MSEFYRPPASRVFRPMRRRTARVALLPAVVLLAVASLAGGVLLTLRLHPRFAVTRVLLEGVPEARRSEVEESTDGWIGRPLLFVDLDPAVQALSRKPWVRSASARRIVPDTVAVRVECRPPVALARRDGVLWTVDRSGSWLGLYSGRAVGKADDFVVIDPRAGTDAVARGVAFLESLRAEDPALLGRLSEVEVVSDGFALTDRFARVRLLFAPDAAEGESASAIWRAFLAVRPELERHGLTVTEADLRLEGRIVLKAPPSGGRGKT